jgi:hypothetical protein
MEDNMEANRERAIYKDKLMNYVDGTPYLCEQHKDTTHVIGAVCPMCVGKERQEMICAYLGLQARVFELEKELERKSNETK